ncbi:unnamed protein product [Ceutorhynchus assimilis]|uniref:Exonuclease domain-containing protein n=1 Tax=Ceutorhynchus assimilis TaxID=467358 RepID=A0A9P0DMK3_9CUCU|nr:unnamed protein product [Ceutorhynchus assimilis]
MEFTSSEEMMTMLFALKIDQKTQVISLSTNKMKGPVEAKSTRKKQRLENKQKKMAALLDIAKLNENDREKGKTKTLRDSSEDSDDTPNKKIKTETVTHQPEVGPSGKPILSGKDYQELKKMLREKTSKITKCPKFWLRDLGENALLRHPLENRCPLFLSDIQHLLMYSQLGVHAPYSPARWCSLDKYNQLANVTVLVIENLSLYHYEAYQSHFPFLSLNFEHKLEIISPFSNNSDVVKELSLVPLSSTQMRKAITEYGSLEEAVRNSTEIVDTVNHFFPIMQDTKEEIYINNSNLPETDKFSRITLLLSGWQMVEENFPLPIKGLMERKYSDYVLTKKSYKSVTAHSPMMGIDCEMCKTTTGDLELTRISVVNEKHEIIYDTLVKPQNKIVDYLTRYSGINPKMMKNVTKRLADVQRELSALLPNDAILVGQSLSNDLHAVKMMHPYVIDTSVIYNLSGDRTRKTKLQILAREFLDMKIQMGTRGHCSSEDSLACLKLVQLKLTKHLYYGDAVMNSVYTEQRAYPDLGTANYATSMLKQCVKAGNAAHVVGVDDLADNYKFYFDKDGKDNGKIKCTKADSNRDVITHLCNGILLNNLNIGHIRIAEDQLTNDCHKVFQKLDRWISEMHHSAVQPSLLSVIFSGNKNGGNGVCCLQLKRDYIL